MGTSLGVADTMALISSKLTTVVPFSCCALFLHNEEHDTLRCRFAIGVDAEVIQQISVKGGSGLTGWVARNRRPLVNARPSADLEAAGVTATTSLQSALVCPLVFNDRLIGTLAVYDNRAECYTDDHRRLLDRVCEQRRRHQQRHRIREDAGGFPDGSCGSANTRFMFMPHASWRAPTAEDGGIAALMDIDNFKDINDGFGHHVGDRALREVAGCCAPQFGRRHLRALCGDEFIVVLSGCGDGSRAKADELQNAIVGSFRRHPDGASPWASASVKRSARTTVIRTRRCWRQLIAACTQQGATQAQLRTDLGQPTEESRGARSRQSSSSGRRRARSVNLVSEHHRVRHHSQDPPNPVCVR